MSEQIIPFDSPEAAQQLRVTGWVSRHGRFYGSDERAARYDGCTHWACEDCGAMTPRGRLFCDRCANHKRDKVFQAMPCVPWDGRTPLFIFDGDEFFDDEESLYAYCLDNDVQAGDLRLVLAEPLYPRLLDEDYFSDDLPEGVELPRELSARIAEFNEALKHMRPLCWVPGKTRVELESDRLQKGGRDE